MNEMKAMCTYTIVVEPEDDGGYYVAVPEEVEAPRLMAITVAA